VEKRKLDRCGRCAVDARNIRTYPFYTGTNPKTGFPKQVLPPDTAGAVLQFPAITEAFRGISLSLGSTYKISDIFNLKFNFLRGYRAPSISEIAANGLDAGAHIIYIGNSHFAPESQKTNWQFQLQVNNVLDAAYQSNMSRLNYFEILPVSPNGHYGIYNMGRNVCAKIIFSF
jgi:outer membrane receptor protein involved in Fe transport